MGLTCSAGAELGLPLSHTLSVYRTSCTALQPSLGSCLKPEPRTIFLFCSQVAQVGLNFTTLFCPRPGQSQYFFLENTSSCPLEGSEASDRLTACCVLRMDREAPPAAWAAVPQGTQTHLASVLAAQTRTSLCVLWTLRETH